MSPVEITWLGQSTLVVRMGADLVVIDVFFSESDLRTYPAPSADSLPQEASVFLCSHMHGDHFDAPALRAIAAGRKIEIIVPAEAVAQARSEIPAASVRGLASDGTLNIGSMTIHGVGVVHGDEPQDAYRIGAYLGFLIESPGFPTFFHGGDLIPSNEMLAEVRRRRPRIMALPINGRDWYREQKGFVGNMSAEEAAITAIECKADVVLPLHYDAVKGNAAEPEDLVRYVRARGGSQTVLVPARNKPFMIGVPT